MRIFGVIVTGCMLATSACGEPTAGESAGATTMPGMTGTSGEGSTTMAVVVTGSSSATPTEGETSGSTGSESSGGAAVCGDGVVEGEEACDDGDLDASDACLPTCELAVCGDLVVQVGVEDCDDGNGIDSDKCTNACHFSECGDGIKGPGEGCDDGNDEDKDDCSNACIAITCGDGVIQGEEECDEGVETAECNDNCTESKCGDGVPNTAAGEACDAAGESPTCNDDCTAAMCGDEKVNAAAGEDCDEAGQTATCEADCSAVQCGDGTLNAKAGELCDDGGESASCDADCTAPACGDGLANAAAGEVCDDGDAVFGDACSPLCLATPIALAPGSGHVCALYADKSVHCWGRASWGQLGQGNKLNLGDQPGELPAKAVDVGGTPVQLRSGENHTCARLDTGDVRCWGYNGYGQLGTGDDNSLGDVPGELPPPSIALGAKALAIDTGGNNTCAIVTGGAVHCWGYHMWGQLGYTEPAGKYKPDGKTVVGVASAVQLALGDSHSCALLADGTVRCWGFNAEGQLGLENANNVGGQWGGLPTPAIKLDTKDDPIQQIVAGARHNCVLLTSGKVRCWGYNNFGQVGGYFADPRVGDKPGDMPPPDVDLGGPAGQIAAGQAHTCALMKSRKVKCWGKGGANGYPGLDAINTAQEMPPPDVDLGGEVASVSSHIGDFTCALLGDGAVRCWGSNTDGQLGLGNVSPVGDDETPASVMPVPL